MTGLAPAFAPIALAMALVTASPAKAQEETADPCASEGACRHIAEFLIEDPEGQEHRIPADMDLPWVVDGNILITPGEAMVVRLVDTDGALAPELRRTGDAARDGELAEGEIRFDFLPFERGSVRLTVESAFSEKLEYAALLVDFGQGPSRTSVCQLLPGVMMAEIWQQPVVQLALWSFRPAGGDDMTCDVIDPDAGFGTRESD